MLVVSTVVWSNGERLSRQSWGNRTGIPLTVETGGILQMKGESNVAKR